VFVFTQAMPHRICPVVHTGVQTPATHEPVAHARPQPPQLLGSLCVSTQRVALPLVHAV
jgi:hypothetical protein